AGLACRVRAAASRRPPAPRRRSARAARLATRRGVTVTAVRGACAALLALAALMAFAAAAEEPAAPADRGASTRWAYDLANDLMSPFCPGRSLADCPSPDAASLRMWILVQAAAGRTRDDVEQELYARYGEVIRAAPKAEGWGLAAYWIPAGV